jgi:glutathione S-transferase
MELYYGRVSGNSARAIFGLNETGVPYELRVLDTRKRENQSPAYLAVNPMGKIPALVDGEVQLWESNAINWYVAEKYPQARLLPQTLEGRASVHRWLFFQAQHVTPACIQVFRATNERIRAFWRPTIDPAQVDAARKELQRYLPVLEAALRDRDWLERDFSLADIAYAPHLFAIAEGGFDFSPHPRVRDWLHRLTARPAWKQTMATVFD